MTGSAPWHANKERRNADARPAWRSSHSQSHSAAWHSWSKQNDWSPPRNRRQRAWDAEVKEKLETIQSATSGAVPPQQHREPPPPASRLTETQAQQVEAKRKAAVRIKSAMALKATLGPEQAHLAAALDQEIRDARQIAAGRLPPAQQIAEAEQELAQTLVRVERAQRHFLEAQERLDRAVAEQSVAQDALDEARLALASSRRDPESEVVQHEHVVTMANTLTSIREQAKFVEDGQQVQLNPQLLEQLVIQVNALAQHMHAAPPPPLSAADRSHATTEMSHSALADPYASEISIDTDVEQGGEPTTPRGLGPVHSWAPRPEWANASTPRRIKKVADSTHSIRKAGKHTPLRPAAKRLATVPPSPSENPQSDDFESTAP